MSEITIQQATFERLQRYAKPFVDTPDTVIMRALDALDQTVIEHVPNGQFAEAEQLLDLLALPDLTHTKILDAAIDGEPIAKPKWNLLRDEMLLRAMRRVDSFENLQRLFQANANLVEGRKEDEGYHYLSDIDVSVQGQHANGACQAIMTAAQVLGISLNIGITWRRKERAAYPGERRRIVV